MGCLFKCGCEINPVEEGFTPVPGPRRLCCLPPHDTDEGSSCDTAWAVAPLAAALVFSPLIAPV